MDRFVHDPADDGDYDLLVVCDCGSLDRLGGVRDRHAALFERLPRVLVDHHASNTDGGPNDWVDPARRRDLRARRAPRRDARRARSTPATARMAAALMAGIVMDTVHVRPSERHAAHARRRRRRSSRPARRCRRSRAASTAPSRTPSCGSSGACWTGSRSAAGGRIIHSSPVEPTTTTATGTLSAHSEGLIDLLAQSETAEVADPVQGGRARARRASPSGRSRAASTRPSSPARSAAADTRAPRARRSTAPLAEARRRVLAEAERLAAAVSRPRGA